LIAHSIHQAGRLGSKGHLDATEFGQKCAKLATKTSVPIALDRVEWRGHGKRGTLVQVDTADDWSHVKWDHSGPVLIHLFELRRTGENEG
jgi:hypothetical protein